jgi:hypothetical protein
MYDIFYVSKNVGNEDTWIKIKSKYPTAQKINNVKDYNQIKSRAFTKMFWVIWDDVDLLDSFNLIEYRVTEWDDMYVHVFKNGDHFDGICLFPKKTMVSKKEFNYRFFTNKKEVDIVASYPRHYPKICLKSYDEYLNILSTVDSDMFWGVWPEIEITDSGIFDLYFSYHNSYDRKENHVFQHSFRNEKTFSNGLVLFSRSKKISQREFDHRFLIEKKEHDILASKFKPYDIVFISYNEPNADENYQRLLKQHPKAKRVDRVKGIHRAHIRAAEIVDTEMFWVVDGDAVILDDFCFDHETSTYERDTVHVWRSQNPINDLVYGYGGVKLLPKKLTLEMNTDTLDMTTAISKKFKAMTTVSNITAFNTDPFNTWKSAFRECVKLSSKIIDRQNNDETEERLNVWCSLGKDQQFGDYAINGAIAGKEYGLSNKDKPTEIKKINDFQWLKEYYEQRTKNIHT